MNQERSGDGEHEHRDHEREEAALHAEHEKEEQILHEVDERIERELHQAEEALHQKHVREEEALHEAHVREEKAEDCGLVKVTIDDKAVELERGVYSVEKLKDLGKVPLAYTLLEERNGKLVPLDDDGSVDIKGCEVFHSRVKSGGSS